MNKKFGKFSLASNRDRKKYKKKIGHYDKSLENNLRYVNYFKTSNFKHKI